MIEIEIDVTDPIVTLQNPDIIGWCLGVPFFIEEMELYQELIGLPEFANRN